MSGFSQTPARRSVKEPSPRADSVQKMALRRVCLLLSLLATSALLAGCAGSEQTGASVPDSASLAPADAAAFATLTTDQDSSQWQRAGSLWERVTGNDEGIGGAIDEIFGARGLDWEADVAPAIGPEVVLVVTADTRMVVLLEPDSEAKLDALLAKSGAEFARAEIEGRVALAEKAADLTAYRTALARGTIEENPAFLAGLGALPAESLGLMWVDLAAVTEELGSIVEQTTSQKLEVGLDWLSAALSAEDDGMLLAFGARTPGGGDTHYEPVLFDRVPADAVAAFSFGGTQGALDRIQGQVDVGEIAGAIEKATGISVEGLLDALTGEGVLYVRPGEEIPEVTLALAPPDPDKTWKTVDDLVHELAEEAKTTVSTSTEQGVEVSKLVVDDVTVRYARLDEKTIVVTTGADALQLLAGDGDKLVDSEGFVRAADDVELGERTKGFLYVDVDGLLPVIEGFAGGAVPPDATEGFEALDSFILQTSGAGDVTRVSGFVRVK